jgi:hypothetical protein
MIAFGTVAGGAGAALTGGNFWQGAVTGLVVSGLNHAMHPMDGPGDPPKKGSETNPKVGVGLHTIDENGNFVVNGSDLFSKGYDKIPNTLKRATAYKMSLKTGASAGKIFQGAKGISNNAGRFAKTLGPVGNVVSGGVIGYEFLTGTWDAHTFVNSALLAGGLLVAGTVAAPVVLTGIAAYGVGDYFFDFSGKIDNSIGRYSK